MPKANPPSFPAWVEEHMNTNHTVSWLSVWKLQRKTPWGCVLISASQALWFLRYPVLHVARARPQEHLLLAPPVHSKAN